MVFDIGILNFKYCFDVWILGFEKSFITVETNLVIFDKMLATFSPEHLVTLFERIVTEPFDFQTRHVLE